MPLSSYQKMREKFRDYLKSKAFTRKSIESRLVAFDQYLKWVEKENLDIEQITYTDLLLFLKYSQQKGISQRTLKHYMVVIRHYYEYLIRAEKITVNPAADVEVRGARRKTVYHILTTEDLHHLYNQYPDQTLRDRRNKVVLGLLVYQGLRSEELAKLLVQDVKLREGEVDVLGSRKANGRMMQLESGQVMDVYDFILQVRPQLLALSPKRKSQTRVETDLLFIGEGGNRHSFSNLMTQVMIKVRKINPNVINAKQIRASVITKWLKSHNLREVQYLAGHRYISSTEGYLQNDMDELKEEVQQYHPLG